MGEGIEMRYMSKTRELLTAEELSSVLEAQIAQLAPGWLAENPDVRQRLVDALTDDPSLLLLPSMSYEEFLQWASESDESVRAEWVEGKAQLMSPASSRHQMLVVFLVTLLNVFVATRKLGVVLTAPFQMRLHQPPRGREPDLLFVAHENMARILHYYLDGPADLVVEIISPESTGRDRGDKFYEYEMAGVLEYWLIDPQRERAEFYQIDEQGHYELVLGGRTGQYHSRVLEGLSLEVEWLWQEPLPPVWTKISQ
jgi:Uma2 family endonuclease